EIRERCGPIRRHRLPRDLIEIVAAMLAVGDIVRHQRHDAGHMAVVRVPERHELVPGHRPVLLGRYPVILLIALEHEIVLPSHAHESLMIVRGRVDQVSDDFLDRPLPRRRPVGRNVLGDRAEVGGRAVDRVAEVCRVVRFGAHGSRCTNGTRRGRRRMLLMLASRCTAVKRDTATEMEKRPAGISAGRFHCLVRVAYCTALIMSKIGKYIATTMPPTTTPRNTIMIGSIRLSNPLTAVSTSVS